MKYMKTVNKFSVIALVFSFAFFAFGLTGPTVVQAATSPSLGTASTYGVLSSTYTDTSAVTTVNGDVGFTTPPATAIAGVHTNYGSGAPYSTAGTDQNSALSNLASQVCTFSFAPGAIDLATDTTHGPIGIYTPGVYCTTGATSIGTGGITLNGSGTYIFRISGALTTVANSVVTLNGASACDVFWTPTAATTLGANSTFAGTDIDASGISVGSTVTWTGRALAFGGTVTTNADTISAPSCAVVPPPAATATLHVIKQVVNNNNGTAGPALFNLHVKLAGTDVAGSPAVGTVAPGRSYTLSAGTYVVSEDANASYTSSFGGACNSSGSVTLVAGVDAVCTITNDDIAVTPPALATLHIIKRVINDNGGTASAFSSTMHVKSLGYFGTDVAGSPASGTVTPGTSYSLPAGTYVVSENADSSYARSFSGDCDGSGNVTLVAGADATCTITNNDIAVIANVPAEVVPVAVIPVLPNTGVGPEENSSAPWNIIIPSGIFVVLLSFYIARKKQLI